MSISNRTIHHLVDRPDRASALVESLLFEDAEKTRYLFELGAVYLNKKRLSEDRDVAPGDYLRIHTDPRRYVPPKDWASRVLFSDEHFLILDKPAGVPCHATLDNGRENVIAWWKQQFDETIFITHRLDVPTSGCLLFARSADAASRFNRMILKANVQKEYEAVVEGDVSRSGLIQHWMDDVSWAPRKVHDEPGDKRLECRLHIRSKESVPGLDASRLRIELETGRTHQIRCQLAAVGHPVLNDVMYGGQLIREGDRVALRARRLGFQHPFTSEFLSIDAGGSAEAALFAEV